VAGARDVYDLIMPSPQRGPTLPADRQVDWNILLDWNPARRVAARTTL
jgi:hypothetical protein